MAKGACYVVEWPSIAIRILSSGQVDAGIIHVSLHARYPFSQVLLGSFSLDLVIQMTENFA
jgi:hypothetical protein